MRKMKKRKIKRRKRVRSYGDALRLLVNDKPFPSDFDQWDLSADEDGWTVAHAAVYFNRLPVDFNRWNLADKDGLTVAHFAAFWGRLPSSFNQWNIADESGWTVAHEAALFGHLPASFDQWNLTDKDGITVRDALENFFSTVEEVFSKN